jgi:hypothetical protein
MTEWFLGRDAVTTFVENVVFAPSRPYGVTLVPGSCNQQPAFAVYQPDESGRMAVTGLQVLDVRGDASTRITSVASYRDPDLARRCGFPRELA